MQRVAEDAPAIVVLVGVEHPFVVGAIEEVVSFVELEIVVPWEIGKKANFEVAVEAMEFEEHLAKDFVACERFESFAVVVLTIVFAELVELVGAEFDVVDFVGVV